MSNPWGAGLDPRAAADRGAAYSARFDRMAARGQDVHGEADLVATLVPVGATVLDAGCGTGRVAARLAELGYRTIGVDLDAGMLGQARQRHPELSWVDGDLADLDQADLGPAAPSGAVTFTAVVAAGNVMPLLTPGTETAVIAALAGRVEPGGLLIAGFGLDDAHLPPSAPATARFRSLTDYDATCAAAGLHLVERWAGWDRKPYQGGGYAVSVHRAVSPFPAGSA